MRCGGGEQGRRVRRNRERERGLNPDGHEGDESIKKLRSLMDNLILWFSCCSLFMWTIEIHWEVLNATIPMRHGGHLLWTRSQSEP